MTVKPGLSKWLNLPSICAQNIWPCSRNRVLLHCRFLESMQPGEEWTECCSAKQTPSILSITDWLSPKYCPIKLSGLLLEGLQKVQGLPWWQCCLVRRSLPTSCSPLQSLTLHCSQLARLVVQLEGELQNWSSCKITFPSTSALPYFSASPVSLILFNSQKYCKWQNVGVQCRGREKQPKVGSCLNKLR